VNLVCDSAAKLHHDAICRHVPGGLRAGEGSWHTTPKEKGKNRNRSDEE